MTENHSLKNFNVFQILKQNFNPIFFAQKSQQNFLLSNSRNLTSENSQWWLTLPWVFKKQAPLKTKWIQIKLDVNEVLQAI